MVKGLVVPPRTRGHPWVVVPAGRCRLATTLTTATAAHSQAGGVARSRVVASRCSRPSRRVAHGGGAVASSSTSLEWCVHRHYGMPLTGIFTSTKVLLDSTTTPLPLLCHNLDPNDTLNYYLALHALP